MLGDDIALLSIELRPVRFQSSCLLVRYDMINSNSFGKQALFESLISDMEEVNIEQPLNMTSYLVMNEVNGMNSLVMERVSMRLKVSFLWSSSSHSLPSSTEKKHVQQLIIAS